MDEKNQNDIEKYLKTLPKEVQDFLAEGVWEERTIEIGKKYGLNETQIDDLVNAVVLLLTGIEKPDKFLDTIVSSLAISKLLAEQIMNDLDNRVFDYALKQTTKKEQKPIYNPVQSVEVKPKMPDVKPVTPMPKTVLEPKVPEVKPQNLPMVEPGEKVHINKPPVTVSSESSGPKITYKPVSAVKEEPKVPETVQRPVAVPRFTGAPIQDDIPVATPIKTDIPENIIENKLKNVTSGMNTPPKVDKPVQTDERPVKQYAVDPYREPTE